MITICLTGGPGGGKSDCQKYIKNYFENQGMTVRLMPEAATIILKQGLIPNKTIDPVNFQRKIISLQLDMLQELSPLEDTNRTIVVFDRGIPDGNDYLKDDIWNDLLDEFSLTRKDSFKYYDCVLYLESSAKGAKEYYHWKGDGLGIDTIRMENEEEAIELDNRTIHSWNGHPCIKKIGCFDDFQKKKDHVVFQIEQFIKNAG